MSALVMQMLNEVRDYVRDIAEQELLIAQMKDVAKELNRNPKPENEEEERRHRELAETLQASKEAERKKDEMRSSLRKLASAVDELRSEINKVR